MCRVTRILVFCVILACVFVHRFAFLSVCKPTAVPVCLCVNSLCTVSVFLCVDLLKYVCLCADLLHS